MKNKKYQLWDMQEQCGVDFNSEIECLEQAMEMSDYSKANYYLILDSKGKLIKSVTVDGQSISWTAHAKL